MSAKNIPHFTAGKIYCGIYHLKNPIKHNVGWNKSGAVCLKLLKFKSFSTFLLLSSAK